jgi:PAS domain S-box-containing protein
MTEPWWRTFPEEQIEITLEEADCPRVLMNDEDKTKEEILIELQACRKRIEQLEAVGNRAHRSESLFGGLLEAAPDGFVIVDPNGKICLLNPQAEKLFGYTREELIGQSIEVLVPLTARREHHEARTQYSEQPTARRMGTGIKLSARQKDGSEFPVEISLSPLLTPDGKFIISAIRDVSERQKTEEMLRIQTEALTKSNDQLQQFAYIASHDLQEPLRMISSYLQLLQRRYRGQLDERADEFIEFAVDGAKRLQALIQDLLAYSRVDTRESLHTRVNLEAVLSQVLIDLRVAIGESKAAITRTPLPIVIGDPTQWAQVFQNLISNSIKFHRPGTPPHIHISAQKDQKRWKISIADQGIGIDSLYQERIFQIFQRLHTREEYPGTGIGLAICKKIIEGWDGEIGVESCIGEGSTFWCTVPDHD